MGNIMDTDKLQKYTNDSGLKKYIPIQGDKIKIIGIIGIIDEKYRVIVTKVDNDINPIGEPGFVDFEEKELKQMASEAQTFFDEMEKKSDVNRAYV